LGKKKEPFFKDPRSLIPRGGFQFERNKIKRPWEGNRKDSNFERNYKRWISQRRAQKNNNRECQARKKKRGKQCSLPRGKRKNGPKRGVQKEVKVTKQGRQAQHNLDETRNTNGGGRLEKREKVGKKGKKGK